ncbi:hypothetical protein ES703_91011 [subsurface metagenome]
MKLEKAIEMLTQHHKGTRTTLSEDFWDAERMGIEALKRTMDHRLHNYLYAFPLLPGETADSEDFQYQAKDEL